MKLRTGNYHTELTHGLLIELQQTKIYIIQYRLSIFIYATFHSGLDAVELDKYADGLFNYYPSWYFVDYNLWWIVNSLNKIGN